MKNDTSAILVGIEKLETSLDNALGSNIGSSVNLTIYQIENSYLI